MTRFVLAVLLLAVAGCGTTKEDWLPQGAPVVWVPNERPTLQPAPDWFTTQAYKLRYYEQVDGSRWHRVFAVDLNREIQVTGCYWLLRKYPRATVYLTLKAGTATWPNPQYYCR